MVPVRDSAACLLLCLALAAPSGCDAQEGEIQRIAEILHLEPGQAVADVGAGDGDFAEGLAEIVGPNGRVYATEVKESLVSAMGDRFDEAGLEQVEVVLGSQDELGLEAGCCDAILLRLVYHHFEDPDRMRTALLRSLVPGGLIAIVDIVPQEDWAVLPGVPDRGGHGIPSSDLEAEMLEAGFEWVESHAEWNGDPERFARVFRKPANSHESQAGPTVSSRP